jgi:hypothetical protein
MFGHEAGLALLERLEHSGGQVVARIRRGRLLITLSLATGRPGTRAIIAEIPRDLVERALDELTERGWHGTAAALQRTWSSGTQSEKATVVRDVDEAIDILVRQRGMSRDDITLYWRSPLQADGGYGQVGCVLAIVAGLVGNALGTAALVAFHYDWIARSGSAPLTNVISLVIGWIVSLVAAVVAGPIAAEMLSSLLDRSPRTDKYAVNVFFAGTIVLSMAVAGGALWLLASVNR